MKRRGLVAWLPSLTAAWFAIDKPDHLPRAGRSGSSHPIVLVPP